MKYNVVRVALNVSLMAVLVAMVACTAGSPVDRSATRVLDNAGSVVKSGSNKLWMEPGTVPATPAANKPESY